MAKQYWTRKTLALTLDEFAQVELLKEKHGISLVKIFREGLKVVLRKLNK
jgi:hypothetical protein